MKEFLLFRISYTSASVLESQRFASALSTIPHYEDIDLFLDLVAKFQAPNAARDDRTLRKIQYLNDVNLH